MGRAAGWPLRSAHLCFTQLQSRAVEVASPLARSVAWSGLARTLAIPESWRPGDKRRPWHFSASPSLKQCRSCLAELGVAVSAECCCIAPHPFWTAWLAACGVLRTAKSTARALPCPLDTYNHFGGNDMRRSSRFTFSWQFRQRAAREPEPKPGDAASIERVVAGAWGFFRHEDP